ncbi:MAG: spermidine/putrescine transport system permease protein, partial [Actinomycetota bacterium]|nr:spermidine/putrescine transport system permease protein [Actinomycetota bacterium]
MAVLDKGARLAVDRPTPTRRPSGPITWFRRHLLILLALLIFLYMFLPVFVVVVFSFNRQVGKNNYTWHGFSLKPWTNLCDSGLCPSLRVSLQVGVIATIVATALGTLVAFGLSRYRFRGRSATNLLIFLPMATPEV